MSVYESFEYEGPAGESHEWESHEWEYPGEVHESHESHEAYETPELNEALEMELAQELLEITTEAELEEFLGKLVRRVARGAGSFMRSGIGRAVGGVLRNVAKTALPMVGSALGSMVAPGLGTAIGGKLGSMAAKLLEAEELESMGEAEAELEAARRYVRWASGTVRTAMRAPYGVPPRTVARSAAVASARRYAPSLLRPAPRRGSPWRARRAPWDPGWAAPTTSQPAHPGCTCGGNGGGFAGGYGDEPAADDGFGYEPEAHETHESHEAFESHEVTPGAGRWYRRGNRIVLLGA